MAIHSTNYVPESNKHKYPRNQDPEEGYGNDDGLGIIYINLSYFITTILTTVMHVT